MGANWICATLLKFPCALRAYMSISQLRVCMNRPQVGRKRCTNREVHLSQVLIRYGTRTCWVFGMDRKCVLCFTVLYLTVRALRTRSLMCLMRRSMLTNQACACLNVKSVPIRTITWLVGFTLAYTAQQIILREHHKWTWIYVHGTRTQY